MLRRFLISLAFATWCFLDTWVEYAQGGSAYLARLDPVQAVAVPALCLEVVFALSLFGFWELFRRTRHLNARSLHLLFLALCIVPFGIASVAALRALPFDLTPLVRNRLFWPVVLIAGSAPLWFVWQRPRTASRLIGGVLLYSWPVLLLVLVQSARQTLYRYPRSAYTDGVLAAPVDSVFARVRIVWIIFDELSQTIVFGNRPADLELPNFDRLRSHSFYASSAWSPADSTEISMPSLILGERVTRAIRKAPDDLQVCTATKTEPHAWSSIPNVFDAARELGSNTALVGWFHPYGRVLNHSLTKCYWTAGWLREGIEEPSGRQPLIEAMSERLRLQFAALPLVGHLPGISPSLYHRQRKIERFRWLRDRSVEVISDASIGLMLIHLPIPHPPAIYDRTTGSLTAHGPTGYLDSVVLADQTLGLLLRTLEQSGLRDRTAVLVSSDHGWRTRIWRGDAEWTAEEETASQQDTSGVPFLLKLPGHESCLVYNERFNTIVTRQILTGILAGQLTNPNALAAWIERHKLDP